ncbi:MAG: amino acid ABC transporter substrate-binding protein [Rhodospirillales bacterium]|nr:amino acid ABC transporter substrate-binding protein [Rhodospirillales bacterium]
MSKILKVLSLTKGVLFTLLIGLVVNTAMMEGAIAAGKDGEAIVTFGATLSMTGNNARNGKHTRRGYELAKTRINSMGGIDVGGRKYQIRIKYYDDESNPALAAKYTKRLITKDKVRWMLGPYGSSATLAVAGVTEKYKIPMVEANGASLSIFNQGYKYVFGVLSPADKYLSEALNLAAAETKAKGADPSKLTVAIAVESDPFSSDIRMGVISDAKKFGMKIIIDENLPRDFADMTFILDKVKQKKPDIFIVSGHEAGANLAVRQIHEQKVDVPMLAMTHCEGADINGTYGVNADFTICAAQWAGTMKYQGKWFGNSYNYVRQFKSQYGYAPPYQAAESSAAVIVLADAIRRAGQLDNKKVRDALAKTDVQTFFGWIKFDKEGRNTGKPMVLRQLVFGRYLVVAPSGFAEHKVKFPRPTWSQR